MSSVETSIINGLRDALIAEGYTVFNTIYESHTGRATKSGEYVMIGDSMTTDWTEITQDVITGPFTLMMRYHLPKNKVQNSNPEMVDIDTDGFALLKAISQVKVGTMYNRFNVSKEVNTTTGLRGKVIDYTITGKLAATQSRTEFNQTILTIQTDNTGPSLDTQFILPLVVGQTYNFDWLTSDGQTGTHTTDSDLTFTFASAGAYTIEVGVNGNNTFPAVQFDNTGDKEKLISFISSQLGNFGIQTDSSFYGGINATTVQVPSANVGTTNLSRTFSNLESALTLLIPDLSTTGVSNFSGMFFDLFLAELDVYNFDMTSCTNTSNMFRNNKVAKHNTSKWDTPLWALAANMFDGSTLSNPEIHNFTIANLTNAAFMLNGTSFSTENWEKALISYADQSRQLNVPIHAGTAKVTELAAPSKAILVSDGWTIIDGGPV